MNVKRAKQYLENVCIKKEIIPFVRYRYGVGRKAQLKSKKTTSGRWPLKSAHSILKVIRNAESNAQEKGLDLTSLYIKNVQVNKAIKGSRRTFRAHGRVNAYLNNPCHIEVWLVEKSKAIEKSFIE
nr:60S ribosomal protein L17 [Cryptomonas sp.]